MIGYHVVKTSWGLMGYVAGPQGLVGTVFPQRSRRRALADLCHRWPNAVSDLHPQPEFEEQVIAYFEGEALQFDVLLDLSDQPRFAHSVLNACARIPYGEMISYGELAKRAGNPRAARAVGNCMNRNPLPLVIPCHRVIRSDGAVGGFGAESGEALKRRLLKWEGAL